MAQKPLRPDKGHAFKFAVLMENLRQDRGSLAAERFEAYCRERGLVERSAGGDLIYNPSDVIRQFDDRHLEC